jgi:methionyl aminopeptidase
MQNRPGMGEQRLPGRKQTDTGRRAAKQRSSQLVFQRPYLAAERRLRDVQFPRGSRHVALLGDGDEVSKLHDAHGSRQRTETGHTEKVLAMRGPCRNASLMGIETFSESSIAKLRAAGRAAAAILDVLETHVEPGITTGHLDRLARVELRRRGARSSVLGHHGFPAAICTSRNRIVCHGIPSEGERLESGDILNVDVCVEVEGFHGDTSRTIAVGDLAADAKTTVDLARRCLASGLGEVRAGAWMGAIGAAIESVANQGGCSVVHELGGHGIGREMHCPPHVPHIGRRGTGVRLRAGMAFTVEPMINLGGPEVRTLDDGWTIVTADGSLSAQFEHTVLVTLTGCEVLTRSGSP